MKKVLYTMAMFSMVAMFAACGGSDKKEEAKDGALTPAAAAEKVAEKACECKKLAMDGKMEEAAKCEEAGMKLETELTAAFKDDEAKMKEYTEAGKKYMEEKCK